MKRNTGKISLALSVPVRLRAGGAFHMIAIALFLCLSPCLTGSAWARSGQEGAQQILRLAPPPEPRVKPIINHPVEIDANRNRVDDMLEMRLARARLALATERNPARMRALQAALMQPERIELVFSRQIQQWQINAFLAMGGRIDYIYRAVSYGWNGTLPLNLVPLLPQRMGPSLVAVVGSRPAHLTLDHATQLGRVRPVWAAGFAGSTSGYSGGNFTIGFLDSGIDGTHTDLAGRKAYWHDYTSDAEASPRDVGQHGTHVAGIALGTGDAGGVNTTSLLYTDGGFAIWYGSWDFYGTPIHLPDGLAATFSSTAYWDFVDLVATGLGAVWSAAGTTGGYTYLGTPVSGTSPLTMSANFTASSAKIYTVYFHMDFHDILLGIPWALVNTVTYAGVGDGFNTFRGVAPGCRWAGGKVFKNFHRDSDSDIIGQGVDDMVVNSTAYDIRIVNMSLGTDSLAPILREKVNNMVRHGIVAVVAAGNDGPLSEISDPARAALAITVAASNDINQLTDYTSAGVVGPDTGGFIKPDLMAPGGSFYYGGIISADSNTVDGDNEQDLEGYPATFEDKRANDYASKIGTSMAAPFVAGSAALVIQAMEESGATWDFSAGEIYPLFVKQMLCMTATESNAPREIGAGGNPLLGRAADPKDTFEGYGMINPDAAIEAVKLTYKSGTVLTDSTGGGAYDRRAWARKVELVAGKPIRLTLDVPATGDFDLYLYASSLYTPSSNAGNPIIRAASTKPGNGVGEVINYTPGVTEVAYLVIKRVSGSGTWTLTGRPPIGVLSLKVSPNPVVGGNDATGKVTLSDPAPSGGAVVTLANTNPAASVPGSVTVPAGATSATFTITTSAVTARTSGTITASYNGASKSTTLTVRPIGVLSLKVSPNPVVGGSNSTGTVYLERPAKPGPISVTLTSSKPTVAWPVDDAGSRITNIIVREGAPGESFVIKTVAVTASTTVTFTATANGITRSASVSVRPVGVAGLSVSPNPVVGGNPVTGTVTLQAAAGPGDVTVALSSSNSAVASVPGSVTVARGSSSATFPVTTFAVTSKKMVTLKASANGTYKTATLTVKP